MKRTLGLNDYLRMFSRTMQPLVRGMGKVLAVNEYTSGRDRSMEETLRRSGGPSSIHRYGSRPERRWPWENSWGYDLEFEHFERELWTEQSFFNDADQGVTYEEAPWDARWRDDEWWR
jgi:hypothetical protein